MHTEGTHRKQFMHTLEAIKTKPGCFHAFHVMQKTKAGYFGRGTVTNVDGLLY